MQALRFHRSPRLSLICSLLLLSIAPPHAMAEPTPAAIAAFEAYVASIERRFVAKHRSAQSFLVPCSATEDARLRQGNQIVQPIEPGMEIEGALLHHWRGTAFAAGASASDFLRLMQNFDHYPQAFAPQVISARTLQKDGDHFRASMRIRQRHVITVVMDTDYDIRFSHPETQPGHEHGYSISHSTRVAEISAAGTAAEHVLSSGEEHGFLWRLNTYWSYEERDGGLYLQIEAVSLTRAIPSGLGWAIRPYIESIPRESLEFTLRSATNALRR